MPAGTWAQLNVSNQNSVLGVGSHSGSMIGYSNSMPWNPRSKVIEIIGQDHGYPSMRHVRYDDATNQFVLVADNAGIGNGHGFDHVTLNPTTGDLYVRLYGGFTGSINFMRKAYGGSNFVSIPSVSLSDQVADGTCWWSGSFTGGGAQGSLMVFDALASNNSPSDGQIGAYNPLTNAWFYTASGRAPNFSASDASNYHTIMEYSASKNVAVYGGGNGAPTKLYRMNSDRSVTAMTLVPSGKAVGILAGILVDEPVTGNFLLLSAGELWELNPSGSGTWTRQTGSRNPPSGVQIPADPGKVICCSIPEYGVVAYISQATSTGGTFYLYKHA